MRGLRFAIFSLGLLMVSGIGAKTRKDKKEKAATSVIEVDSCSVDTFSYAFGMANTQGLKGYIAQNLHVDTAYMAEFIKGLGVDVTGSKGKKLLAYGAGLQIRQQLEGQILPGLNRRITQVDTMEVIDHDLFVKGFIAALKGKGVMDMTHATKVADDQMKRYSEAYSELKHGATRRAGEDFLKENALKEGVQTLPSGVQYKVLTEGTGDIPTATSKVKVNYEGRLVDGTVFDSSYKRNQPATFGCNQVIKGWTEALTHMPVGSKWEIYIPQELGYGSREAGKIPPFSALIFTVELLEIEK